MTRKQSKFTQYTPSPTPEKNFLRKYNIFKRKKQTMEMTQILELTFWEVPARSSFLSPLLRVDVHKSEQLSQPCPAPAPFSLTGALSARSLVNSISPWCLLLWGPSYTTDLRNLNLWTDALVMILRLWCSWHLQVLWEHRLLGPTWDILTLNLHV